MDKRKKVLMLIPNLDFGGAQRVFYDLSVFLSKRYDICESVFNFDYGHAYPTQNKVVSLNVPGGESTVAKLINFIRRCRGYRGLKNKEKADVSISHMEGANYVNVLSGGYSRNIVVEHGSKLAYDENRFGFTGWLRRKILISSILRHADHVVVVSRGIKKELVENFNIPDKMITVVNNSFDLVRIESLAKEPLSEKFLSIYEKPVIITSGRLAEQKNQLPLLDVLKRVKDKLPCRIIFLGEGHLKLQLIDYAQKLGLRVVMYDGQGKLDDADVYFLGFQENPFNFIANADIFTLPSAWEGFPLALCEAMISGVPVMSTDCRTGPREILAPETEDLFELKTSEHASYGILMPLFTEKTSLDCWSSEIIALLKNSELKNHYKKKGKERMLDFGFERVMKKWINVIEQQ
jgi:glycosyltransferase involved in cell wall biosynthesis